MEDGDPNLPTYTEDEDWLTAWIDSLAARAEELQLPLTHPRFNKGIIWIKKNDLTVSRKWSAACYFPDEPAEEAAVVVPNAAMTSENQQQQEQLPPDGEQGVPSSPPAPAPPAPAPPNPAIAEAEKAADLLMTQKTIIEFFFRLVRMGQTGLVTLCIQKGLVSPDVTDGKGYDDMYGREYVPDDEGQKRTRRKAPHPDNQPKNVPPLTSPERGDPDNGATPLLTAVDAGDANMVRTLLSLGADVNHMARPPDLRRVADLNRGRQHKFRYGQDDELDRRVRRTPLMLAAAQGRIALVRLFWEEMHADDALVAPDGYTALRLAAHAGHRDIVALLPARRGGAWRRFSTRHGRAVQRIRRAGDNIVWFVTVLGKVVFWHAPRALFYHIPVELVVQPLASLAKYLWQHRREILPAVGRWLAKLPRLAWHALRDFGLLLADLAKALGRLVKRLPQVLKLAGQWVVASLRVLGNALAHVVGRAASVVHTAVVAVLTFFRSITWANIKHGLEAVVLAVFFGLPKAVWTSIEMLGRFILIAANTLFSGVTFFVCLVGLLLFHTVVFVPRQLWKILTAIGSMFAAAFHEVVVCFDPKRVV
ncbi:hypothetical protein SCUCBS95973_009240 [Sporothrix curviconia]|uniref:Ankyrin repeat protein n=1 Tax=Sporothrix curviconia TaxID=1260050 RepID=A0ABP0CVZ5_9PEZI